MKAECYETRTHIKVNEEEEEATKLTCVDNQAEYVAYIIAEPWIHSFNARTKDNILEIHGERGSEEDEVHIIHRINNDVDEIYVKINMKNRASDPAIFYTYFVRAVLEQGGVRYLINEILRQLANTIESYHVPLIMP